MAKPIKETPILYGKDAEEFIKNVKEAEQKQVSEEEKQRMKENFDMINALATFK